MFVLRFTFSTLRFSDPFTMSVAPLNLGGVFLWPSAQCSSSISGSGDTFTWNCPMNCTCCGCTVEGQYSYEGYWLPATSCLCGCYYDGTGPKWGAVFRASRRLRLGFFLEIGGHLRGCLRESARAVGRKTIGADTAEHCCTRRAERRVAFGSGYKP